MLPHFPDLQRDLGTAVRDYVNRKKAEFLGPIGRIPGHHIMEGHDSAIIQEDGKLVGTNMVLGESEVAINFEEFATLTLAALLQKFDKAAHTLAETQAKHFYATLAESVKSVSNTIDGMNQPLTAEMYLVALDRMHIEFSPDGSPHLQILIHPSMGDAANSEMQRLQGDPILRRCYEELMTKKFGEWRAREASRELA